MGSVFFYPWNRPVVMKPDFTFLDSFGRSSLNPSGFDSLYTTKTGGTASATINNPNNIEEWYESQLEVYAAEGGNHAAAMIGIPVTTGYNSITKATFEAFMAMTSFYQYGREHFFGLMNGVSGSENMMGFRQQHNDSGNVYAFARKEGAESKSIITKPSEDDHVLWKIGWSSGSVTITVDGNSYTINTNVPADGHFLYPVIGINTVSSYSKPDPIWKVQWWRLKYE